jgi:PAS domain S-box-containing protein
VCLFRWRAGPPIPTNLWAARYWAYLLAQGRHEHWELRKPVLLLVGCLLLFQDPAPAQVKEVRRVLVFNDLGSMSSPGFAAVDQAIAAGLEKSPYQIEFYNEHLEATLFPEEASQRQFREWFAIKYHDRKPDVIIAAGQASLKFMVESHEKAFPNTAIIFCGSTEEMLHKLKLDSYFTGVWAVAEPEKTLKTALRLQPATKHVVVVGGVGTFDRDTEGIVRRSLRNYESTLDFTYLTDLDVATLLERLRHLPSNTIVFHTSITQDAKGTRFIDATQSVPMVASAANAPVFVLDDVDLGLGSVGGDLLSWAATGQLAAEMAVRVLNGEKPQDIPIVKSPNVYMFDGRALRRWGFKESNLPPDSVVLYRQPTAWESYKWYIIVGIALIVVETLLLFGLVWHKVRRRRAEHKLRESQDRLAGIVGSAMDAIIAIDEEQRIVLFNAAAEKMFGCTQTDAVGTSIDRFVPQRFRLEHGAHLRRFGESGVTTRSMGPLGALWAVHANGREFPIEASISHVEADRRKLFTVIIRDITERRLAEQALRESEERFRLVANTAPVMIWMSGTDKLCNYFNQPWLEFTGRSIEAELGNGWAEMVHPEDFQRCLDTYQEAFDRHERFQMQYRLRRHDGEYRWLLDIGVPRLNPDGSFAGYIGSCIDVTERRLAEEAMASMGRRLIEAHEEERTWIGRELHDDVSQRLALVVIELEQWGQKHSKSEVDIHEHIGHIKQRLSDLGKDVQALSHRLHSSKLDYLGLTVAANGFCREFSEQQNVEIDFTHEGMPRTVPKEISLCLFRILQEALQNAVKYSGVRHFSVKLEGTSAEVKLTISDNGAGFDQQSALSGRGLGLISMRERIHLVKGELSITSQPAGGTTVYARVPFEAEERRTRLAG